MATPEDELSALLERCSSLLSELSSLQAYTKEQEVRIELTPYRNLVKSERKTLEKTLNSNTRSSPNDPAANDHSIRISRALRSSNLPYLEAVWSAARSTTGLVSLHRRFRWSEAPSKPKTGSSSRDDEASNDTNTKTGRNAHGSVLVDVVAREGTEWIKVSTLTEKRLLFELARAGRWDGDYSDEDSDSEDGVKISALHATPSTGADESNPAFSNNGGSFDGDTDSDSDTGGGAGSGVHILRLASSIMNAAARTRVHYHRPVVRFVLPRITEGRNAVVDGVLADLRQSGVVVDCGRRPDPDPPTSPETAFRPLLPTHQPPLTDDLNVDCTILLALTSDVSHGSVEASTAVHPFIAKQIAFEAARPLLPTSLYPALSGRRLHTSAVAAQRMREIVKIIGTPSEIVRTDILFGEGSAEGLSRKELLQHWGKRSDHSVPELDLPVRIVEEKEGEGWVVEDTTQPSEVPSIYAAQSSQPSSSNGTNHSTAGKPATRLLNPPAELSERVLREAKMSAVNRAVWFLGWATGWVTVSSNRVMARTVEEVLEKVWRERMETHSNDGSVEDVVGPTIWMCGTARSLVGKEIRARRGNRAETTDLD